MTTNETQRLHNRVVADVRGVCSRAYGWWLFLRRPEALYDHVKSGGQ